MAFPARIPPPPEPVIFGRFKAKYVVLIAVIIIFIGIYLYSYGHRTYERHGEITEVSYVQPYQEEGFVLFILGITVIFCIAFIYYWHFFKLKRVSGRPIPIHERMLDFSILFMIFAFLIVYIIVLLPFLDYIFDMRIIESIEGFRSQLYMFFLSFVLLYISVLIYVFLIVGIFIKRTYGIKKLGIIFLILMILGGTGFIAYNVRETLFLYLLLTFGMAAMLVYLPCGIVIAHWTFRYRNRISLHIYILLIVILLSLFSILFVYTFGFRGYIA